MSEVPSDQNWTKVRGGLYGAAVIVLLLGALLYGYHSRLGSLLLIGGGAWLVYLLVTGR
ncbi:hypothetical protein HM1_0077 [Heliomicrobium modesticaldum Ice1]|uniref:Uncharacterized protein n=1 Tax=Heliobacterium modesticaldum (strain ATCC 51547 / Ice1) TaxID=498761 RepID=B0TI29_HELMI|nr:hypothetical protein HM1_0077 [Heliomicrobium modesticaldum Ice1]